MIDIKEVLDSIDAVGFWAAKFEDDDEQKRAREIVQKAC
jgi:hypothetical protein